SFSMPSRTGPAMRADPRTAAVEELPTVTLEHARTGQPMVVDLRDYLAGRDGRFADWRLLGRGGFIDPPALPSEGGPPHPEDPAPEAPPEAPAHDAPVSPPPATRRRRRKSRRSRQ